MKSVCESFHFSASSVIALTLSQVAHAQDTGTSQSIIGVDDIVVTAQIQSENLQKVPLVGAPTAAKIIVLTSASWRISLSIS
jgi:hypothetical protein